MLKHHSQVIVISFAIAGLFLQSWVSVGILLVVGLFFTMQDLIVWKTPKEDSVENNDIEEMRKEVSKLTDKVSSISVAVGMRNNR